MKLNDDIYAKRKCANKWFGCQSTCPIDDDDKITMTMNKIRQKTTFLMQLQKELKADDSIELPTNKKYMVNLKKKHIKAKVNTNKKEITIDCDKIKRITKSNSFRCFSEKTQQLI